MKHLLGIVVFGLLFAVGTGAAITTVRTSKPQIPAAAVRIVPHDMNEEPEPSPIETRLVDEEIQNENNR